MALTFPVDTLWWNLFEASPEGKSKEGLERLKVLYGTTFNLTANDVHTEL